MMFFSLPLNLRNTFRQDFVEQRRGARCNSSARLSLSVLHGNQVTINATFDLSESVNRTAAYAVKRVELDFGRH